MLNDEETPEEEALRKALKRESKKVRTDPHALSKIQAKIKRQEGKKGSGKKKR
jgi:hypothetical protein